MRVVLVNPSMDAGKLGTWAALMEPMPVLGLAYLVAAVEAAGHTVTAIDQFAEGLSLRRLTRRIVDWAPDVLGIGMLTPSAPLCADIATVVKEFLPSVRVVVGNVHADVMARQVLEHPCFDVVVHGEGEETLPELLEAFAHGRDADLASVAGVSYRDASGEILRTASRPRIADLDALALPNWDAFPIHRYGLLPLADLARPTLVMGASRGCPYRCEFCSLLHAGSAYRRRNPVAIADEFEHLHRRYGARQVGFVDPIFPLDKATMNGFCTELINRGLNRDVVWISETRVDRVDRESLRLMKAAGCRRLLFGIESGVDMLLENVNKTFTTERVRHTIELCREEGLSTVGLFMIGLPGETEEMTWQTIDFACGLGLDFAKFAITIPYPGSQMFDDLRAEGRLDRDDWENFSTFQPDPALLPFVPRKVSPEALIRLQKEATRRFYMRPRVVARQLLGLRTMKASQVWNGVRSVMA